MTKAEILNIFNVTEKELCERVLPKQHEILFLSGSLFDGLGNNRSDLDIFLITDDSHPFLQNERIIDQNIIVEDKRYDLSIFPISLISETAEILRGLDFSSPEVYVPRQLHPQVSNYEICTMVHRLKVGAAIYNHLKFGKILEQFPFFLYIKWLVRLKLNEYDGLYEDVVGSLESKDFLTTEELIQQQLRLVAQLLVLSTGETFDREKWVPRKLLQVVQKGLLNKVVVDEYLFVKKSLIDSSETEILQAIYFCERQIETLQLSLI